MKTTDRHFVTYFHYNGWWNINFGISLCLLGPHIEIHVPFGFARIGWAFTYCYSESDIHRRPFGYGV